MWGLLAVPGDGWIFSGVWDSGGSGLAREEPAWGLGNVGLGLVAG